MGLVLTLVSATRPSYHLESFQASDSNIFVSLSFHSSKRLYGLSSMNSLWMTLERTPGTNRIIQAVMRMRPSYDSLEETHVFGKRTMVPISRPIATQSILSSGCAEASHSLYRYVHLYYPLSSCTLISLILVIPFHVVADCNFSS